MDFFKGQERRMSATNCTFQLCLCSKKQFIQHIIDSFQKWISSSVFISKLHLVVQLFLSLSLLKAILSQV